MFIFSELLGKKDHISALSVKWFEGQLPQYQVQHRPLPLYCNNERPYHKVLLKFLLYHNTVPFQPPPSQWDSHNFGHLHNIRTFQDQISYYKKSLLSIDQLENISMDGCEVKL